MSRAGLFAGEVTQEAPSDGASTLKQEGYHWFEWQEPEETCFPLTEAYFITRGPSKFTYMHVDYETEVVTKLGEQALTWSSEFAGFGDDSDDSIGRDEPATFVITPNIDGTTLVTYQWDGTDFYETNTLDTGSFRGLNGFFGCSVEGWVVPETNNSILTGAYDSLPEDLQRTVMGGGFNSGWSILDFRHDLCEGYGPILVITPSAPAARDIYSFEVIYDGTNDPAIVMNDSATTQQPSDQWGWDRNNGGIINVPGGDVTHVEMIPFNIATKNFSASFNIELGYKVSIATVQRGILYAVKATDSDYIRAYSGTTEIDALDHSLYLANAPTQVHCDTNSYWQYWVDAGDNAIAVEILADGTFGRVIELTMPGVEWASQRADNCVRFFRNPIAEIQQP